MGGSTGSSSTGSYFNDVWQSSDGGATWSRVTASAGWAGKSRTPYYDHSLATAGEVLADYLLYQYLAVRPSMFSIF